MLAPAPKRVEAQRKGMFAESKLAVKENGNSLQGAGLRQTAQGSPQITLPQVEGQCRDSDQPSENGNYRAPLLQPCHFVV
jgi:hypothetical protein